MGIENLLKPGTDLCPPVACRPEPVAAGAAVGCVAERYGAGLDGDTDDCDGLVGWVVRGAAARLEGALAELADAAGAAATGHREGAS